MNNGPWLSLNSALSLWILLVLTAASAAVFRGRGRPRARRLTLLAADLVFLWLLFRGGDAALLALLAILLVNYAGLRWMASSAPARRPVAAALIGLDLAALAAGQIPLWRSWAAAPEGTLVILGAAFTLLRLGHLIAESLDGAIRPGLVDYLNFLLFFPAFLSGPLDRFDRFYADLDEPHPWSWRGAYDASCRVIAGLFKLHVLAYPLTVVSLQYIRKPDALALPAWKLSAAALLYGAQIYFFFSGASDIAIGLAAFIGIRLPENFDHPYRARNLQEFWSRWHITFVSWLRDYLYYPLAHALSQPGRLPVTAASLLSIAATFVLAGLWHGTGSTFALYGAYHAAGFILFLAYRSALPAALGPDRLAAYRESRLARVLANAATIAFVCAGLVIYRGLAITALFAAR